MSYDPAEPVDCKYGAPMGRPTRETLFDITRPLHMQRLLLDTGGYDKGGAYWGHGEPIFVVFDATGTFYWTTRAKDREAAKVEFRQAHPTAFFYGEKHP